jgi:hypothetical protein
MNKMNLIRTNGDFVCTEPFKSTELTPVVSSTGIKKFTNLTGIIGLKVLAYGPNDIKPGDVVWVSARDIQAPYARGNSVDGGIIDTEIVGKCIFVPLSAIKLIQS